MFIEFTAVLDTTLDPRAGNPTDPPPTLHSCVVNFRTVPRLEASTETRVSYCSVGARQHLAEVW